MTSLLVTAALLAAALPLPAAEGATSLVLRAERDRYGEREQHAVVFEGGRVVVSRNSNFLCAPSTSVALGAFALPYDERRRLDRDTAEQISLRSEPKGRPAEAANVRPHGVRIYLGEKELTQHEVYGPAVRSLIEATCPEFRGEGQVEKGAAVASVRGAGASAELTVRRLPSSTDPKGRERTYPFPRLGCQKTAEGKGGVKTDLWRCRVPGFGYATAPVPYAAKPEERKP